MIMIKAKSLHAFRNARFFSSGIKKLTADTNIALHASVLCMLTALTVLLFVEASRMGLGVVPLSSMWARAVWMLGGMALGGMVLPGILRSMRPARDNANLDKHLYGIPTIIAASLVMLALFVWGDAITTFFTPAPDFSHIAVFVRGIYIALGLLLFFGCIPPRMHGRCLGAVYAIAEVLRFLLVPLFTTALSSVEPESLHTLLNQLQNARIALAATVVLFGFSSLILWRNHGSIPTRAQDEIPAQEPAPKVELPLYRLAFTPVTVIGMAALGFTLNGYLNGILEYVMRFFPVSLWLHPILAFVFPMAGIWIDKSGCKAMRFLVALSACSFLLLPALLVTSPDGVVYNTVRYSGMLSLPVFSFCMVLLVGRGPFEGKYPGLMCISVHTMFFLAYYGFALDAADFQDEIFLLGMALPVGIIALIFLSFSSYVNTSASEPEGALQIPDKAENEEEATMTLEEFVLEYSISPRKKELLVLLLDGASTKRIAATMGIAEYTVRLHIHEILRKVGLHSRKCLIKRIRQG